MKTENPVKPQLEACQKCQYFVPFKDGGTDYWQCVIAKRKAIQKVEHFLPGSALSDLMRPGGGIPLFKLSGDNFIDAHMYTRIPDDCPYRLEHLLIEDRKNDQ